MDLSAIITGVHFRSNLTPDIDIADPFAASQEPNPFLASTQPQITLDVIASSPIVIAPYGTPGSTGAAVTAGAGLSSFALIGLAIYGAYKLIA